MICVLLSGGLDSSMAFLSYIGKGRLRAIWFDYGQKNAKQELEVAESITSSRGVDLRKIDVGFLGEFSTEPGVRKGGISKSFLPGRNDLLLSIAASQFASRNERVRLVIGSNLSDASGFPDCRHSFLRRKEEALKFAYDGFCDVTIESPWIAMTKSQILQWAIRSNYTLEASGTVSCYRGTRCMECDACIIRKSAFDECGIHDGTFL